MSQTSRKDPSPDTRMRLLLGLLPVGVFECDVKGHCHFVNERWCEISGMSRAESMTDGLKKILQLREGKALNRLLKQLTPQAPQFRTKIKIITPQGVCRWVEIQATGIFEEDQKLTRYVGIVSDYTDQKELEDQIELEKKIDKLLTSSATTDELIRAILETVCNHLNFSYSEFWVYSESEQALTLNASWSIDDSAIRQFETHSKSFRFQPGFGLPGLAYQQGRAVRVWDIKASTRYPRAEFAVRTQLTSAFAIPLKINNHIFGTLAFYSEKKEELNDTFLAQCDAIGVRIGQTYAQRLAEVTLENERVRMIEASKMTTLGEMAGGISHEINNPLAIISGKAAKIRSIAAKALNQNNGLNSELTEEIRGHADKVEKTALRIAKIIRALKAFAREGSQDPFQEVALGSVIEDTLEFCRAKFESHGIKLNFINNISDKITLQCRPVQLSQVLLNLLSNAHDATEELSTRWISIETKDHKTKVELRVSDSGPGIPESVGAKIFDPFFTTKEIGRGTGLGLSISMGIVEQHHGRLFIDSKSPHTCFVLVLPKIQKKEKQVRAA